MKPQIHLRLISHGIGPAAVTGAPQVRSRGNAGVIAEATVAEGAGVGEQMAIEGRAPGFDQNDH